MITPMPLPCGAVLRETKDQAKKSVVEIDEVSKRTN